MLTMSRKRDDSEECPDRKDGEIAQSAKRIKSPLSTLDQTTLNEKMATSVAINKKASVDTKDANLINPTKSETTSDSSVQSSGEGCHNRKRRPRITKDVLETDTTATTTTTNSQVPRATTSVNSSSRKKSDLSCVVCCGLAHGYNFDAISCESCKAFFRRNALFNQDRLKCRRDGCCDISLDTRRRCKSCRLKKCFDVGMRKEWILTEEEKLNKKRRIEENRRLRQTSGDESVLSKEKGNGNSSSAGLNKINLYPSPHAASFDPNNDVMNNVMTAFNAGFKLDPPTYGWSYPLAKKVTALCQILHTKNTTALRLIGFYKGLAEFDALNEMDKVNLIKYNLPHIFILHASLGYDAVNDIYHEGTASSDTRLHGTDIREIHGNDIYLRCTLIMRALHTIVQMDQRIIQLALIIILFSKGLSGLVNCGESSATGCQQVLQAQNVYAEQLWLLMEKAYGPSRAVVIFSTLISKCLLIQELLCDVHEDIEEKVDLRQVSPVIHSIVHLSH